MATPLDFTTGESEISVSDGIFLLNGDQLVEMNEQPYDTEDVFQSLLAKYPNLLAGGQINRTDPRRWLLVSREIRVPSEQDGGGRWSLDHLFLDQDAIPTLIEVKRSSDTRIRREVVGQMLDYAANAVAYWPVEKIRAEYEASRDVRGIDPDEEIEALVNQSMDVEQYWHAVKANLQLGRIRMVFVADVISTELQRIIEFLNQQMNPAEVLAVEIKQYVGQELKTLVPRVIGQTVEAEDRKSVSRGPARQWDEATFVDAMTSRKGVEAAAVARELLAWAKAQELTNWWGKGSRDGSFVPILKHGGEDFFLFAVWTYGRVEIQFQHMIKPPLDASRIEILNRLNAIPGIAIPIDSISRRPSIDLATLSDPTVLKKFLDVFEWAIGTVKGS